MNLHEEDLILLVIFQTLMETRSVSKANERLNLSQLSMSNALARLDSNSNSNSNSTNKNEPLRLGRFSSAVCRLR